MVPVFCLVASASILAQSTVSTGRIGAQVTIRNVSMKRNDGVVISQRFQDSVVLKSIGKKASMYIVQTDLLPVNDVKSISAELETNLPVELTPQQCSTLRKQSSSLTSAFARISIEKYDGNHQLIGTEVIYGGLPGRKSLEENSSEIHSIRYNVTDQSVQSVRLVGEFYLDPTSYNRSEPTIVKKGTDCKSITISASAQVYVLDASENTCYNNRSHIKNTSTDLTRIK
jgi:hypothetical protein